jgi:AraC family transcriptional regulator
METDTQLSDAAQLEHDLLAYVEASQRASGYAPYPCPGTDLVVVDIQRLASGISVALVMHLLGHPGSGKELNRQVALAAWRLQRMTAFADAHLHEKLSIAALARAAGFSTRHFTRAFREQMGDTPHHWLMKRRIEKAKLRLTESDDTLEQIATTCGFSAQSHFTRVFRLAVGESPKRWRQLYKES